MELKDRKYRVPLVAGVLLLFGVLYGLEAVVNHLMFRTYGLDLGLYTNALYDYAHLHGNDSSFFLWQPAPLLADHFDLLLVLLSPLVYLFGSYTLLVVQMVSVLAGAYGVYKLAQLYADGETLPLLAMLMLLTSFGVWQALGFDYHSNVVAAMLLPWLLWAVRRERFVAATLLALAMAIAKETSALFLLFVLVALMFDYRRNRRAMRWLLWATLATAVYLAVVTLWVMPSLGGSHSGFWRYDWMGGSFADMAVWLLTHPLQAVANLFVNFTGNAAFDALKPEFYLCALASGLLLCLLKPNYLLMLIPPLAMKMLSADAVSFWGVANHYNIEICVVVVVASAIVLARIPSRRWRTAAAMAAVALTVLTLLYTTGNPHSSIRKDNVRILDARHYRQPDFSVDTARRLLGQIPADASVCATTMFTPHLATRDSVYIFPMGLAYGADYYLLLRHHWCYYEGEEDEVAKIINDTVSYHVVDTDGVIYLVERNR